MLHTFNFKFKQCSALTSLGLYKSDLIVIDISLLYAIVCKDGDIRLAGGPNQFEGRLEYCSNSSWGHVCGSHWDTANTMVACNQLDSFISSISQSKHLLRKVWHVLCRQMPYNYNIHGTIIPSSILQLH